MSVIQNGPSAGRKYPAFPAPFFPNMFISWSLKQISSLCLYRRRLSYADTNEDENQQQRMWLSQQDPDRIRVSSHVSSSEVYYPVDILTVVFFLGPRLYGAFSLEIARSGNKGARGKKSLILDGDDVNFHWEARTLKSRVMTAYFEAIVF